MPRCLYCQLARYVAYLEPGYLYCFAKKIKVDVSTDRECDRFKSK